MNARRGRCRCSSSWCARCRERDPELARDALAGLARLRDCAARATAPAPKPEIARVGGACLRDHGGDGPPAVLIPSLINPPRHPRPRRRGVAGRRDRAAWAGARCCSTGAQASERAGPRRRRPRRSNCCCRLLRSIGEPAALIGYCLGGTMAIAAANLVPMRARRHARRAVEFRALSGRARAARSQDMWRHSRSRARERSARCRWKCCRPPSGRSTPSARCASSPSSAALDPASAEARRFVELEDWANEGEPLPYPAAQGADRGPVRPRPARIGQVDGRRQGRHRSARVPLLNLTAARDRIAPAATAPAGENARDSLGPRRNDRRLGANEASRKRSPIFSGSLHEVRARFSPLLPAPSALAIHLLRLERPAARRDERRAGLAPVEEGSGAISRTRKHWHCRWRFRCPRPRRRPRRCHDRRGRSRFRRRTRCRSRQSPAARPSA